MAHYSNKQRIDLARPRAGPESAERVRALFLIAPPSEEATIVVRPVPPAACCMALVESSFALDPGDIAQARGRLGAASALARSAPAFEIAYPRDYARLPDVRQAILDQLAVAEDR